MSSRIEQDGGPKESTGEGARAGVVLVAGGRLRSDGYPRNEELVRAMAESGWTLRWSAVTYPAFLYRKPLLLRLALMGVLTPLRWVLMLLLGAVQLARGGVSHIFVPFPAQLDLPPAWLLARLGGCRLVADVFLSSYNTLVEDRGTLRRDGIAARLLHFIEGRLLGLADINLIDTPEHAELVAALYPRLAPLRSVPLAIDEERFRYAPPAESSTVVFWGTYIPLHGVQTILEAAALLQEAEPGLQILLIGRGQEYPRARELAASLGLRNVDFEEGILPMEQIIDRSRSCFAALGVFGATRKAAQVLPYKAVHALALGLPLINADTPASRRYLENGVDALLVPPGDAAELANAIQRLFHDRKLATSLSQAGRRVFESHFSRAQMRQAVDAVLRS
ncbi:MAG: glycosyltransferase [Pseudomonadota bacterium]